MSVHVPRKRFGQHFLRDKTVIERIANAFNPRAGEAIVEIGPGEGVLTRRLLERITEGPLHAVELDRDLVAHLRQTFPAERLIVHQADALDFDFRQLAPAGKRVRLVGNLPYNISTPILFHLLEGIDVIHDMVFMLQKEVVDRLAAAPDTSDYGRLSVMVQWQLDVEPLFDVPPTAFYPPPKVESTVVRLTPRTTRLPIRNTELFARVVKAAFASRRKTLKNNLTGIMSAAQLQALGIDPGRRAETLSLQEFADITNALSNDMSTQSK